MTSRRRVWGFIIVAVLVCAFLATFLLPSQNQEPRTAPRVKSASNLRQIGQAILLYSEDFSGQYPDTFQSLLMNEDITSIVFVSPMRSETPAEGTTTRQIADELDAGGHVSYVYLGRGLTAHTVTPNMVVAYEMPASANGGGNVLFGDGHVEYCDGDFISHLVAKVATGEFPVTMPSE
jgi:prepilin-type processing-associated H-X9-DG protein